MYYGGSIKAFVDLMKKSGLEAVLPKLISRWFTEEFVKNNANRPEVIYAAANNGILHAISTQKTGDWNAGEEIWGFIPPLIVPKFPLLIN